MMLFCLCCRLGDAGGEHACCARKEGCRLSRAQGTLCTARKSIHEMNIVQRMICASRSHSGMRGWQLGCDFKALRWHGGHAPAQIAPDRPGLIESGHFSKAWPSENVRKDQAPLLIICLDADSYVLQIELGLVGLDLVLLVMGQELVSFKIVDAALSTEIASVSACNGPCGDSAVIVALTVEDMSLRDMQVAPPAAHDPLVEACSWDLH